MNLSKLIPVCAFAGMSISIGASEYCPTLTTTNLAEAACSTETNLFKTDPTGLFGYYADPVCPWGMKTKKWLQSWIAAKPYAPTLTSHTDGKVRCTYKLPNPAWKHYLNRSIFVASTVIDTPELANYWLQQSLCPNLTLINVFNMVKNRADGLKITVKNGDRSLAITFFDALDLDAERLKRQDLPDGDLQGEAREIQTHFAAKCSYKYKGSDKENPTIFELISQWPEAEQAK